MRPLYRVRVVAGGVDPGGADLRQPLDQPGSPPPATTWSTAFTIVEVLVVMAIILILAGLVLGTSSYVHNKGARSRAEAEIAAMSAALENYKADNGVYPSDAAKTDTLDPRAAISFPSYQAASLVLYKNLSGDANADGQAETTSYMSFKNNQLQMTGTTIDYLKDPFGNSYGYSTAGQASPGAGYNPTFDLWSTAGATTGNNSVPWIKNW